MLIVLPGTQRIGRPEVVNPVGRPSVLCGNPVSPFVPQTLVKRTVIGLAVQFDYETCHSIQPRKLEGEIDSLILAESPVRYVDKCGEGTLGFQQLNQIVATRLGQVMLDKVLFEVAFKKVPIVMCRIKTRINYMESLVDFVCINLVVGCKLKDRTFLAGFFRDPEKVGKQVFQQYGCFCGKTTGNDVGEDCEFGVRWFFTAERNTGFDIE